MLSTYIVAKNIFGDKYKVTWIPASGHNNNVMTYTYQVYSYEDDKHLYNGRSLYSAPDAAVKGGIEYVKGMEGVQKYL